MKIAIAAIETFSVIATVESGTFSVVPRQAQLVSRPYANALRTPTAPNPMRMKVAM